MSFKSRCPVFKEILANAPAVLCPPVVEAIMTLDGKFPTT
jgi:hypothetical protein